jgi:hypothetical protein
MSNENKDNEVKARIDDAEGHGLKAKMGEAGDDAEGHGLKAKMGEAGDDDAEGHGLKAK